MNKFKSLCIIITIFIISTILLNGCSENTNDNMESPNSEISDGHFPLVVINTNEEVLINDLINEIKTSKSTKESNDNYIYSMNDIMNIDELYIPSIKIDGYKLYRIKVNKYRFFYYYTPIDELDNAIKGTLDYLSEIRITIARKDKNDNSDPMESLINQARYYPDIELTEEGYLLNKNYLNGLVEITFPLDSTWMSIVAAPNIISFNYKNLVESIDTKIKTVK